MATTKTKKPKQTKLQRLLALVEKMTGEKPTRYGRHHDMYSVEYKNHLLSWEWDEERDGASSVHVRRADDIPDSMTDYFPGSYYDSVELALKSLVQKNRKVGDEKAPELSAILGIRWSLSAGIGWKPGAGFVPQAFVEVSRWVKTPESRWGKQGFVSETFTLTDPADVDMVRRFVEGGLPAGILLDWLQDRDMQGLPGHVFWKRVRGRQPLVVGRLDRLLSRKAGE